MRPSAAIPATLLAGLVLLTGIALPASAAPYVGGTAVWTLMGTPQIGSLAGQVDAVLTFQNNLNVTVLGQVVVVAHNSLGQTVYYSASTTLNIPAGANSTAYAVIFGVTTDSYNMTFFAISTSGVAISSASSATLTV